MLSNLIVNAVQAMDRPGRVVVELGPTVLRDSSDGRRVEHATVHVRDEGAGIPADVLPHVFEPFFTTKDVGEGTGLGLSVAHGIIEEHGGKIEIESTVGAGTRVSVYLPIEVRA
ncbi:ATP-binding protein [Myxococcota bacterium]|nr:ATP-binding protein [Myxococcota bacterium]